MMTNKWYHAFMVTALALCGLTLVAGCSGQKVLVRSYPPENMIHMDQLKTLGNVRELNRYIIYVNKGDVIPLALSLESEFMDLKQGKVDIIAKQRLYFMVRIPENISQDELNQLSKIDAQTMNQWSDDQRRAFFKNYMIYISRDALRWAPLSSVAATREVLGYKKGLISFGLAASTQSGLGASLCIKTIQ